MKMHLLIGLAVLTTSSFASDKGNGGFLYSRTSKKLLDTAQVSLVKEFAAREGEGKDRIYSSANCSASVDMEVLGDAVKGMSYSYTESSSAINPDGVEELRYFHIRDGKIEATKEYFQSFVDTFFRYDEGTAEEKDKILKLVRTPIIHEGLHLFNYNEEESRKCAPEIESVLNVYGAGKLESLKAKIQAENDKLVLDHLMKVSRPEMDGLNLMRPTGFAQEFDDLFARRVWHDVIKNDPGCAKEDINSQSAKMLNKLSSYVGSKKPTKEGVARLLNQYIKFTFEKEVPQKY